MRRRLPTAGSAIGGLIALVLTAGVVSGGWVALSPPPAEPLAVSTRGPDHPDAVTLEEPESSWGRWSSAPIPTTTTEATTTTVAPAPPTTPTPTAPARAPRPSPSTTVAPAPAPAPAPDPAPAPAPPPAAVGTPAQQAMLAQVNGQRAAGRSCGGTWHGPVPAVSLSGTLSDAATGHALDMATHDFFSHTGSDGSDAGTRMRRAGYDWSAWGENIAAGQPTGAAVVDGWFASPGHCANFMSPLFTQVGFGQASLPGTTYGLYWVAALGAPR